MKLLLIFSEGSHDVSFVERILKICFNAKSNGKLKLRDFPTPLPKVLEYQIKNSELFEKNIDEAMKFFFPSSSFVFDNYFVLIFQMQGKDNVAPLKSFLANFLYPLFSNPNEASYQYKKEDIKYLFITDADNENPVNKVNSFIESVFPITESDSVDSDGINIEYLSMSSIQESDNLKSAFIQENQAIYIWPGYGEKGTLEKILIKIAKSSSEELLKKAGQFVEDSFSENYIKNDIAEEAKKEKSILTCAGQGKFPGLSLASILRSSRSVYLFSDKQLKENEYVKEFCSFLKTFIET